MKKLIKMNFTECSTQNPAESKKKNKNRKKKEQKNKNK